VSDNTHVCMTGLGRNVRFPAILLAAAVVVVGWFAPLPAQDLSDLDDLLATPLEELMEIDVTLASGIEESIFDAPAAMVVITAEDIRQRGYTNLAEVIVDLPGFDTVLANGVPYLYAYQRGYRTPSVQRTLLMIDGHVDNHLWTQVAWFTRRFPVSSIKRVEVLYGPASAVYGPNAFLGIVNIVTHDGRDLDPEKNFTSSLNIHAGSYLSRGLDLSLRGKSGEVAYSAAGRAFRSDEPDVSDQFGFITDELYRDRTTWGPILDQERQGRLLGTYYDPTENNGLLGNISFRGTKAGFVWWEKKEGYGPQYVADRVQNNTLWNSDGTEVFVESDQRVTKLLQSSSLLSYRKSHEWGSWAEALPDWNPGMAAHSYISLTEWNSISDSYLFKQQFELGLDKGVITGGFKYERKDLTKAYDIPGYWNAFSSTVPSDEPGPYGFGAAIGHSSDATYTTVTPPSSSMPPINRDVTKDIGGFIQGIFDNDPFRFNVGVRLDHNSLYGRSINPRASVILKPTEQSALKLLYGEAFQEPAPILLWGGWNGRNANPDLKPEKARNLEFVGMARTGRLFNDVSLFYSHLGDRIPGEVYGPESHA